MVASTDNQDRIPRAIEVGFPIGEVNRLVQPERNSFKPIYQMHKWFARRASCVFRAILLGALKPAWKTDGTPTDLMEEFYRNHGDDPDTTGKAVLDPFMGGGTTVVEALRLGCRVIGIDLKPVAWFIVKTQIEPVDLDALQDAFERLAARPVAWNNNKPLRETLLGLYRTKVAPDVEADVIYTFLVKHAVCTVPTCKREVPLFKDWLVAHKTLSVRYHRDILCPRCRKRFDWEIEPASLIADTAMMVNSPRGSAGEGRPHQLWTYAPEPEKPKGRRRREPTLVSVHCPRCKDDVRLHVPWDQKKERKKVPLTVLLCPACEAVWQWRGTLPDDAVSCPACGHGYDPRAGNLPAKGTFECSCGNRDKIIESIRLLPRSRGLPVRPYAIQAYLEPDKSDRERKPRESLFGDAVAETMARYTTLPDGLLLPKNGKFFKRFSARDRTELQRAESLWTENKTGLPYPKSRIPKGAETTRLLEHHYGCWHDMFSPRQLLALATLLECIMAEKDGKLQEMLLCAFSSTLEANNLFTRARVARKSAGGQTVAGLFARHDYQPKLTIAENNVFGIGKIGGGSYVSEFQLVLDGLAYRKDCWEFQHVGDMKREKVTVDGLSNVEAVVACENSMEVPHGSFDLLITDPPYVGNVNYSELADFFYVWIRLVLKDRYAWFTPELTPKSSEIVETVHEERVGRISIPDFLEYSDPFINLFRTTVCSSSHFTTPIPKAQFGKDCCSPSATLVLKSPLSIPSTPNRNPRCTCSTRKTSPTTSSTSAANAGRTPPTAPGPACARRSGGQARAELTAIEAGRYGNRPLPEPDVRLVCIGKCLELYSAHYDRVLDHEGNPLPLHKALQDIGAIIDQLVTREQPLPPELEDVDALSYAWLRVLMPARGEVGVDKVNKGLRAMQVNTEDLKKAGLIIRGRTGRGRTYEVKQPLDRLEDIRKRLRKAYERTTQGVLFQDDPELATAAVPLVDLLHALIALAEAGEPIWPWIERFPDRQAELRAGLRFLRDERADWAGVIDRVLAVIEGAPLFNQAGMA